MLATLIVALAAPGAADAPQTALLLGGTLVERAQEYGHWEAATRLRLPQRSIRVRNLGWSGDTVWAESRGRFDKPAVAYERLIETANSLSPDVLVLGYGNAELLAGVPVAKFVEQYRTLLKDLPAADRVFLTVNPVAMSALDKPRRSERGDVIRRYNDAIAALAAETGGTLVRFPESLANGSLTDDGVQWNGAGYEQSAPLVADGLAAALTGDDDAGQGQSVVVPKSIRAAIVRKDRLVFHRFRPQNTTYLLLFRKHEQGQNAGEIEQFEQPIKAADEAIDRLIRDVNTN